MLLLCGGFAAAQNPPSAEQPPQAPPVRVNILNVCSPAADARKELQSTLARLPKAPVFATDFEISRGIATGEEADRSRYVRLRREFKPDSPLVTVQYSLSADARKTVETLVFRGRDVKDLLEVSIEDQLSTSVSKPDAVVRADTPATRVRVERFGKTTVAAARCGNMDQSQLESIFSQASSLLADYRRQLRLRSVLSSDLAWLASGPAESAQSSAAKQSPAAAAAHPH
jgi:hypothetical protein